MILKGSVVDVSDDDEESPSNLYILDFILTVKIIKCLLQIFPIMCSGYAWMCNQRKQGTAFDTAIGKKMWLF